MPLSDGTVRKGRDMRILCFGDSNTFGFDPRGFFGGRYSEDCRWPEVLGALSGHEVINEGQNGRTVPHRERDVALFCGTLKNTRPDLLIIMLGTNDLLAGFTPEDAVRRMDGLLNHVPDGIKVLLVAPPAITRGEWVADERTIQGVHSFAELYRELADRRGLLFFEAGDLPISHDGVHLSEEGSRQLGQRLWGFLRETANWEEI